MAEKLECPGCNSYLSSVLAAYREGRDCPVCGLPCSAMDAVFDARKRNADEDLQRRFVEAEKRAADAEHEASVLRARLNEVRTAIDRDFPKREERW